MLISSIIFKNIKSGIVDCGHYIVCNEVKHNVKFRNIFSLNSYNKNTRTSICKYFLIRTYSLRKNASRGYTSRQHAIFPNKAISMIEEVPIKSTNEVPIKSSFQDMMQARKTQAHRSILMVLADKNYIPSAIASLEKYGTITYKDAYSGESENCFLFIEFSDETSVRNILKNSEFQAVDNIIPASSRILKFPENSNSKPANVNINLKEESYSELTFKTGVNMSEFIEKIYFNEKLTELDIKLRFFLCSLIKDAISGLFSRGDVLPFGSSVNGVGKRGCDLDIVMRLNPEKLKADPEYYFLGKPFDGRQKNLQQGTISCLGDYLHRFFPGMSISERVIHARVPIYKMKNQILNIDFDLSVRNISAVLMSDLLYFCGEIDYRVRPLIHIVKRWAKEANITHERPGSQISNFGLTNLVIYFLQSRASYPILPPLNDALVIEGLENSYDFRLQYKSVPLKEWKKKASLNEEPLDCLLKEFLVFLYSYPFHEKIISLLSRETRTRDEDAMPLYVQYALDEGLNITKNVSKAQYDCMCEKARLSVKHLENNFNETVKSEKDFSVLLGIPSVSRIGVKLTSNKFNVRSVLENEKNFRNKSVRYKMV